MKMACRIIHPLVLLSLSSTIVSAEHGRNAERSQALMVEWLGTLDGVNSNVKDTPVTRVVKLLKEIGKTLQKEQDEDEALYKKLSCWCSSNEWEKGNSIEDAERKIAELESTIESLTARSAALKNDIAEAEAQFTADKQALAEATAQRNKDLQEYHGAELDSIQALENLKAAIEVLSKHHGGAFPQLALSLISTGVKDFPFESKAIRSLDTFMEQNDFTAVKESSQTSQKFLQQSEPVPTVGSWSQDDMITVKHAMRSASALLQARHGEGYYPSYSPQSGEIMGVLKQLRDEMEADLSASQKTEKARAATFAELREAKTMEIEAGEKMAEQKEDEKAKTDNNLAEAKEDHEQTTAALTEDQKFMMNLKATCKDAQANFDKRKQSRLNEMQAVTEAITILQGDVARDAMSGTFNFLQVSSTKKQTGSRRKAAMVLMNAAARSGNPMLSALATSVELDAFTKVKQAIDNMIAQLKIQQQDEVKMNNWCKGELHTNEMATLKEQDRQKDLEAAIAELSEKIKALENRIQTAHAEISQLHVDLQKATEDRQAENMNYQKTFIDQTTTIEVLLKALDRLANYYDKASFVQTKQTPPVPQMEYKPNKGAAGVMEMLEKLVHDSRELRADSKKAEIEAQKAYESLVADTNAAVADLQKEIVSKSKARAKANKDKKQAEADLSDTLAELEGLAKYNADLHKGCDYLLKNFDVRQNGRAEEIEALQQAKQILNGANLA